MEEFFYLLLIIAVFAIPIFLALKSRKQSNAKNENVDQLDKMIAKYGTKYTDGLFYSRRGYNETIERKFDEIRQWTAEYGDEEARKMYKEKYCSDKKQESGTTGN